MNPKNRFLPECESKKYGWVVLPVPYEETTSYLKGTAQGPAAILECSEQLEVYDPRLGGEFFLETGVFTDLEWEFEGSLLEVGKRVEHWLGREKKVLVLGGEHTVTFPAVQSCLRVHPDLAVVILDAHADLRDSYEGSHLSHACVARRVREYAPVSLMGVRAYSGEEADFIQEWGIPLLHAWEMDHWDRVKDFLEMLPEEIYLSVDVDVFDPGHVPTVGTPQPGGLTYNAVTRVIDYLMSHRAVVGADVVETRPVPGLEYGVFTVASLCHFILSRG